MSPKPDQALSSIQVAIQIHMKLLKTLLYQYHSMPSGSSILVQATPIQRNPGAGVHYFTFTNDTCMLIPCLPANCRTIRSYTRVHVRTFGPRRGCDNTSLCRTCLSSLKCLTNELSGQALCIEMSNWLAKIMPWFSLIFMKIMNVLIRPSRPNITVRVEGLAQRCPGPNASAWCLANIPWVQAVQLCDHSFVCRPIGLFISSWVKRQIIASAVVIPSMVKGGKAISPVKYISQEPQNTSCLLIHLNAGRLQMVSTRKTNFGRCHSKLMQSKKCIRIFFLRFERTIHRWNRGKSLSVQPPLMSSKLTSPLLVARSSRCRHPMPVASIGSRPSKKMAQNSSP